jgi:hypothetical protein
MARFDDFKEMLSRQQIAATNDPDFPLNQLVKKQTGITGPKLDPQEFAELQHDLAEASIDPDKFLRLPDTKNIPESEKQKALDNQRRIVAEMKRNSTPPNGVRNQKQQDVTKEEEHILNLAQRTGFAVTDEINYTKKHPEYLEKETPQNAAPVKKPFGDPIQQSLIDSLSKPPSDEDVEVEII